MKIVRTYSETGDLWGETSEGAKVRWNPAAVRWEESSILHDAPDGPPDDNLHLGPIDEAWNKKFPPFSGRRLLFFLAALPFIALGNAAWRKLMYEEDFSWGRYLFVVIAGSILLVAVFAYQWWRGGRIKQARPWAPTRVNEILISTALFFLGLAGSTAMVDGSGISPLMLASLLVVSALVSVLLQFRLWMIMAVLVSAGVGFIAAIFLTLFNTFMGGSTNVFWNWLMASAFAFAFLGPTAWGMKVKTQKFERSVQRIPTWLIAALVCVFMLLATGFYAITEGGELSKDTSVSTGPPHLRSTAMSPRIATQLLVLAWQKKSRSEAERVASPEVVDEFLAQSKVTFLGCGNLMGTTTQYRCSIQTPTNVLLLEAVHTDGGFYIGRIQHVPLGTKLN